MSPIGMDAKEPRHDSGARRVMAWARLEVVEPTSRDALGVDAHRLEAMAFWRIREHPACLRYDSRRSLMDDNPTSG
jgi:hypothetical protein